MILSIWATIVKELLELYRDRTGVLVLVVMPMALVLIVSLVQDNVMQATGEAPIKVLFVDQDQSYLGKAIEQQLKSAGGLALVKKIGKVDLDEATARKAVVKGDFQFCVIIPPGTGNNLTARLRESAIASLGGKSAPPPTTLPLSGVKVVFDPAVQGTFRAAVMNALHRVILGQELQQKTAILQEVLPREVKKMVARALGPAGMMQTGGFMPELTFRLDPEPVLKLNEEVAFKSRLLKRPTAAQQNVPAWALFGMFFIVVPLSGALIRERQTGAFLRLMTMPVPPLALLTGKVVAYVLVCLIQFAFMLAVGVWILPLFGTSGLELGTELPSIALIAVCAALAATGYGLMVGTLAKTYEQASMFGSVSTVIAAALGGIMMPVYVMPRHMQEISTLSPLAWGLNALQDVFVRGGTFRTVVPEISSLLAFFVVTMTVAWIYLRTHRSGE